MQQTISSNEFVPVILGGDITAYSLARAFHEAYGVRSVSVSRLHSEMISRSGILENIVMPDLENTALFAQRLCGVAARYPGRRCILLACGDWYVRLIAEHRAALEERFIIPYIPLEQMNRLVRKNSFYRLCAELGIPYPKTVVCDCAAIELPELPFGYPIIAKPAASAEYHYAQFPGKRKVYRLENETELRDLLRRLRACAYPGKFLLQEFVPGDDTSMRILTCYSDQSGKVRFQSSGHVLLEDHAPMGVGNPVAILKDCNRQVMEDAKRLLEHVGYTGFSNFDIRYDARDGSYKFLEINTRLGRSNYYVTAAGDNVARWLVEDLLRHALPEHGAPVLAENTDSLYTVVPRSVILDYVRDPALRTQVSALWDAGKAANPLDYAGETSLERRLYVHYFLWKQRRSFLRTQGTAGKEGCVCAALPVSQMGV